ncbi:unnamed protein product (macronuclear) [Paramecium tetraurelia]|uniref:Uncharacterized protein n=1 Tax=Paramecium tetraurelia TaxID=5888 RepID=A0DT09_PARTE|nr:uncharacterized protein GSPATT00019869001 [Paramecium tetraurelia]CAK86176.1 unnamed protein product [Paramecium tetraurelia]|eukprot:XP_001453573.1 hypothetical protein (macronuclear) [Paramecium tetraurelia strain d4-2]
MNMKSQIKRIALLSIDFHLDNNSQAASLNKLHTRVGGVTKQLKIKIFKNQQQQQPNFSDSKKKINFQNEWKNRKQNKIKLYINKCEEQKQFAQMQNLEQITK